MASEKANQLSFFQFQVFRVILVVWIGVQRNFDGKDAGAIS